MSDNEQTNQEDLQAANENAGAEAAGAEAPQADADPMAELAAENAEMKDQLLRLAAEMDNLRKRTEREVKDARTYAVTNFARDMLVATDNLSRALMVVSAEARENADDTTKSLIEGIEMTEREMLRLLEKHGVSPIQAEGEKFDPHRHQAMFEVPNTQVPEGTVVQVLQTGFAIGDRVLRPAMVGVAKGGPKADAASAADPAAPETSGGAREIHIDKKA